MRTVAFSIERLDVGVQLQQKIHGKHSTIKKKFDASARQQKNADSDALNLKGDDKEDEPLRLIPQYPKHGAPTKQSR